MKNPLKLLRDSEHEEVKQAVVEALSQVAANHPTVIFYKPVIQINMARGGGATVNVR